MTTTAGASVDGVAQLHVDSSGRPQGTPIVFLHPSGSNASAWEQHRRALGGTHHCLAVDLPGHRCSRAVGWQSLEATADLIAAFIRNRAGGRAHVVGLSLGGSVALTLMARHQEVLDHVIVDGAGAVANPWAWLLKGAITTVSPALHSRLMIRAMASALQVAPAELPSFAAGMRAIAPSVFRRAFCQAQDVRVTERLLDFRGPTLLVAGERDPRATRKSNATLAALLPEAEARFLPGAGHAWMAARPQLHIQMVNAWILGDPLPAELPTETAVPLVTLSRRRAQVPTAS